MVTKKSKILLIYFFCMSAIQIFGNTQLVFRQITGNEGLSVGKVKGMMMDESGFMWFGTPDGLNRWDGRQMKLFRHEPNNPLSICDDNINDLLDDGKNGIWIATRDSGIIRMNIKTERFEKMPLVHSSEEIVETIEIAFIKKDNLNNYWAASRNGRLLKYDSELDAWRVIVNKILPGKKNDDQPYIQNLAVTDSVIWLSTRLQGLISYNTGSESIKSFIRFQGAEKQLEVHNVLVAEPDADGFIWVGTHDYGFLKFNSIDETFTVVKDDFSDIKHQKFSVRSILHQGRDSLWVATAYSGLFLLNKNTHRLQQISSGRNPGGLNFHSLLGLYRDRYNTIWVSTNGMGINYFYPKQTNFEVYSNTETADYGISVKSIRAIIETGKTLYIGGYLGLDAINVKDKTVRRIFNLEVYALGYDSLFNTLLIGCEGHGLFVYDIEQEKIQRQPIVFTDANDGLVEADFIFDISPYTKSKFLIGTNLGLAVYDIQSGAFDEYYINNTIAPDGLANWQILSVLSDDGNRIWAGGVADGFIMFDPETKAIRHFNTQQNKDLLSNKIHSINHFGGNELWIATDRGLNRFDIETEIFSGYTTRDGLPNNVVYSALKGESGQLWLSTNAGICAFDPSSLQTKTYTSNDGLPNNEFNTGAYLAGNSGKLYFGGIQGVVSFFPAALTGLKPKINPVVTRVFQFNEEISVDTILPHKHLLTLPPGSNYLTFEVSALNHYFISDSYFRYRIPQFSEQWINNGRSNAFSLIQPGPGKYDIEIQSSIDAITWLDMKQPLKLSIRPYYYETVWFRILILILAASIISAGFIVRILLLKKQERKLVALVNEKTKALKLNIEKLNQEVEVRKSVEHQLRTSNRTKDKFFSIIAHDLRSPFNSLIGLTGLLKDKWELFNDPDRAEIIEALNSQSKNTYKLLTNLLDWSRVEQGVLKPFAEDTKLEELLQKISGEISGAAKMKQLELQTNFDPELIIYADRNMAETVFRNLFSNAIKFTHPKGKVSFEAQQNGEMVDCKIMDNGVGMNADKLKKLFKIENTKSQAGTAGEMGSGLGLIIVFEFVKLMKGKVDVESTEGRGTTFTVSFPAAFWEKD